MSGRKEASHDPLTLRACLDQVATLGTEYVVTAQGTAWSASEVLAWLSQHKPSSLTMPMYLRLPSPRLDGAICELFPQGGFVLRYRIESLFCNGERTNNTILSPLENPGQQASWEADPPVMEHS